MELVTFGLGIAATLIGFALKESWSQYIQRKRLAIMFLSEISSLLSQFKKMGGDQLFDTNDGNASFMITDQNFFVIYDTNANYLGIFNDDLAKNIVKLYVNEKGFLCTIKTWDMIILNSRDSHISFGKDEYSNAAKKQYNSIIENVNIVTKELESVISEKYPQWIKLCFKEIIFNLGLKEIFDKMRRIMIS